MKYLVNKEQYISQVNLLLNCLPALREQNIFALKGGTAINFFIRDLPRLSVDIDLTFLKYIDRNSAISEIEDGLRTMSQSILQKNPRYKIRELKTQEGILQKLLVIDHDTTIKIEPNFIMRGTLLEPEKMNLKKYVEEEFAFNVKDIPVLAQSEIYAGKICAALSRQHPRDFFDVKELLSNEGITDNIRQAFVVYLVCSPRPIHELLNPNLIDISAIYKNEFLNMAKKEVLLNALLETRKTLIKTIQKNLSSDERNFILSIKSGNPDYTLLPFKNIDKLPAVQWKLINIKKMDKKKYAIMLEKLKSILEL
ncbi:MAG: hypothetical protein A3E84_00020 [Gammaproteobacteria bacterium RIFCSPHIGHO2_12_FULL_42_13]|nr:MAG: hypothetical protein A3E84_00020 [Gammaproteobacteria bacterium RIFCSPHIGHO2_12_FULL_42_13]